jgi:hypothetical protein
LQLSIPVSILKLPIDGFSDGHCLASILISNQVVGLIAVNAKGILRIWENASLPDQYRELELELDGTPSNMVNCEVRAQFI